MQERLTVPARNRTEGAQIEKRVRPRSGPGDLSPRPRKASTKAGIEITVLLDGQSVSSRWFSLTSNVQVGDSHGFDVFCPLSEVQEIPAEVRARLVAQGYLLKNVHGVPSVGVQLFTPLRDGCVRLTLPEDLHARLDGLASDAEVSGSRELSLPFSGELQGAGPWRLRFCAYPVSFSAPIRRFRGVNFFAQSLLFGFALIFGVLGLGFLDPQEFEWEDVTPTTRHRLAILQIQPQKKPQKVEDEPVAHRLQELRIAPRRTQAAPRPRVTAKPAQQLRATPSRGALKLTDGAFQNDLSDPDAGPAEPDADPSLDEPGSTLPVVPVAPAPPPPPPPPPRVVTPAPAKLALPPKRISFPAVDYPDGAKHLGLTGKVKLKLFIDSTGKVVQVEVLAGLHPLLDRAAENGARSARYEPARDTQGRPMDSTATVTVRFELEEE